MLSQLFSVVPNCPRIAKFVLVYRHFQKIYQMMIDTVKELFPDCEIEVFNGYPEGTLDKEDFWPQTNENSQNFLIIDDCSDLIGKSFEVICRGLSHHLRITVVYISQDYVSEPKAVKNGLKNAGYFLLTKSSQSGLLLSDLNRKMFMYNPRFLSCCFDKIVSLSESSYPYMLIDKTTDCDKDHAVRTGLFEGEHSYILSPL